MKIINALAIKAKFILNNEYIDKNFDINTAKDKVRLRYHCLCTLQYKLAIMAMDLNLANQLFDCDFSDNLDIDNLVFGDRLQSNISRIELITDSKDLIFYLHFLFLNYGTFSDKLEQNYEKLGISTDETKRIINFKIDYIVENFAFLSGYQHSYEALEEIN